MTYENDETVGQAAERILPNHVWDPNNPQDWMYDVERVTGVYPLGMFVWCYGERRQPGDTTRRVAQHPHPLTDEAVNLLILYYERRGMERVRGVA